MEEAKGILEDFVAGRLDAAAFQSRYLVIWRDMRDGGQDWVGESGRILGSIFDSVECFDPGLASGEPTTSFVIGEAEFRREIVALHRKLHTLQQAA